MERILLKTPNKSREFTKNKRKFIYNRNIRVALKNNWKGERLPNHWVITSYEKLENSESLYTSPLITKRSHLLLNSNENLTTNALKSQEPLSEQAKAEKLAKLESEKLEMDKRSSKQKECRENREPIYIKAEIDNADIIHSFIQPARTLKE